MARTGGRTIRSYVKDYGALGPYRKFNAKLIHKLVTLGMDFAKEYPITEGEREKFLSGYSNDKPHRTTL